MAYAGELVDIDPSIPFQFGVNFPLVDISLENGSFEIASGTHLLTDDECRSKIQTGEIEALLKPLLMSVGDIMLRDVRALHRGTPNYTNVPRPMVVMGYNRVEHRRPQLGIQIPKTAKEHFSQRAHQLFRLNPIVDTLATTSQEETYSNLYFLEN